MLGHFSNLGVILRRPSAQGNNTVQSTPSHRDKRFLRAIDKIHHFIVVSFQSGYMVAQVEENMLLPYSHATFADVKEKVEKK